jgi:hypothetical protein
MHRPVESVAKPRPFSLILSVGGGFAGQTQGYTLSSDGEVRSWSQMAGSEATIHWKVSAPVDTISSLARQLEPFLDANLAEVGNMTTRIQYVLPDTTYQWSKSGPGFSEDAPEPFRTWYSKVESFCHRLKPPP